MNTLRIPTRWVQVLAALSGVLFLACAHSASQAADMTGGGTTAAGLIQFRHQTRLPVFDPRRLSMRWIDAINGIDPSDVAAVSARSAGKLAILWRDKAGLACDCVGRLLKDEVFVNAEPIYDSVSGLAISVDEPTYMAFAAQTGYPLTALELNAATMANLAYANNDAPLRAFLDANGFALDYAYGMLNAGGLVNPQNLHLFIAHQEATGEVFIAIRGTADIGDMTTNFTTKMVPWKGGPGMVHEGFSEAAQAAATLIRPVVTRLHHELPDAHFYAAGHSLGAAIAVFLSLDLAQTVPIHTIGVAMPPLGDAAFASREANGLAGVDSYFVAHDEIRSLAYLAHRHNLDWVGREIDLGDMGQTAGHYHFVINYMKGMLAARHLPVTPFEHAVPICVLRVLPCLTDRYALLPLCVFENQDCLTRNWPEMAQWLEDPVADRPAHLRTAQRLQRDLVDGTFVPDVKPFVLTELAAWHGADDPATGLRFLDTVQRSIGNNWLLGQIRARLTAKTAAASP